MWSLGLITYILLSGRNPFFHSDEQQMCLRVAAGTYDFKGGEWGNISSDAKVRVRQAMV